MKRRDFAKSLVFPLAAIVLTANSTRARAASPPTAAAAASAGPAVPAR